MKRSLYLARMLACGFFDNLETFAGFMADALTVPASLGEKQNAEIDAEMTARQAETRPSFLN